MITKPEKRHFFTGYYAVAGKYPPELTQVRISSSAPHWWGGKIKVYVPEFVFRHFKAWKAGTWKGDYRTDYLKQLEELKASGVLATILAKLPNDSIFLCYERDVRECHRSYLTEFLVAHDLADVTEFQLPGAEKACACRTRVQLDFGM